MPKNICKSVNPNSAEIEMLRDRELYEKYCYECKECKERVALRMLIAL